MGVVLLKALVLGVHKYLNHVIGLGVKVLLNNIFSWLGILGEIVLHHDYQPVWFTKSLYTNEMEDDKCIHELGLSGGFY